MLQQALFVKALSCQLSSTSSNRKKSDTLSKESNISKNNCVQIPKPQCIEGDYPDLAQKTSRLYFCHCKFLKCKDYECDCNLSKELKIEQKCRYVSVRVKTATVACNTSDNSVGITKFQNEHLVQQTEMIKLRNENVLLKRELQKAYDEGKLKETSCYPKLSPVNENPCALLNAFEENVLMDDTSKVAKDAESEMIITLQNCKNEVSYLN